MGLDEIPDSFRSEKLILRFGNPSGNDIDLFIVSENAPHHQQVRVGQFDLTILPPSDAHYLASNKDILLTTPIANGILLSGDEAPRKELLQALQSDRDQNEVATHHLRQSFRCFDIARRFFSEALENGSFSMASHACSSLTWAASYRVAASWYRLEKLGSYAVFDDILRLDRSGLVEQARDCFRRIHYHNDKAAVSDIEELLKGIARTYTDHL